MLPRIEPIPTQPIMTPSGLPAYLKPAPEEINAFLDVTKDWLGVFVNVIQSKQKPNSAGDLLALFFCQYTHDVFSIFK